MKFLAALFLCLLSAAVLAAPQFVIIKIARPTTPGDTAINIYERTSPGTTPGPSPTYVLLGTITPSGTGNQTFNVSASASTVGTHYYAVSAMFGSVESSKSGEASLDISPGAPSILSVALSP